MRSLTVSVLSLAFLSAAACAPQSSDGPFEGALTPAPSPEPLPSKTPPSQPTPPEVKVVTPTAAKNVQILMDSDGTFEASASKAMSAQAQVHVILSNATTGEQVEDTKPYASELAMDLAAMSPGAWSVRVELIEGSEVRLDAGAKFEVKLEQLVRVTIQLRAFSAGLGQLALKVNVLDDTTKWQAKMVAAGNFGTCALTTQNTVFCWGQGQSLSDLPVQITGFSKKPVRIHAGRYTMCASMEGGGLECFTPSRSSYPTSNDVSLPQPVMGLPAAEVDEAILSMGVNCARVGGDLYCWSGEVASSSQPTNPTKVDGMPGPIARVFHGKHAWFASTGFGIDVQLNDGSLKRLSLKQTSPSTVPSGLSVLRVEDLLPAGTGLALSDTAAVCDGRTQGATTLIRCNTGLTEFGIPNGDAPVGVALKGYHLLQCAAGLGGTKAWCWGHAGGDADRPGAGFDYGATAQEIGSIGGPIEQLSVGARHACAINSAGELFCWGRNDMGQLGVGAALTQRQFNAVKVNRLPQP